MISPSSELASAPRLRREFELEGGHGDVASAVLHLSALGIVEAWIDGEPVSAELLTPVVEDDLYDGQTIDARRHRFVLSGRPDGDVFEPTMTFHGFRYAEVTGYPGELNEVALEAVVVHSDMRRTGCFSCSDELLTRLHENVVWSFKGKLGRSPHRLPPTRRAPRLDGGHRRVRPGGRLAVRRRGLPRRLAAGPRRRGSRRRRPRPLRRAERAALRRSEHLPHFDSTAVWSDAAVWVPWALWEAYGSRHALATQYPTMAAHVRRVASLLSPNGLWDKGLQLGDWLDPDAPPDQPWMAKANRYVVATARCYRSARMTAEAARLLGSGGDAEEFDRLADGVRAAFTERYVREDGTIESDAATVYALAVSFGVVGGVAGERAGARLAELVAANGYRVSTGFAGTPFILDALGAVADWMHRTIGGIAPLEPGYERVRIAPRPGGGLTWAEASLDTRHGHLAVGWRIEAGRLRVTAMVPDGVSGVLELPGEEPAEIGPGRHEADTAWPVAARR